MPPILLALSIVFTSPLEVIAVEEKDSNTPDTLPHRPPIGPSSNTPDSTISKELFFTMDPIDVPIFKDGLHQGYLGVTVTWQARNIEGVQIIKILEPRLRDMIIVDLLVALHLLWKPDYLPNKDFVTKRLLSSGVRIVGPDVIAKVHIRDFYVKKKAGR